MQEQPATAHRFTYDGHHVVVTERQVPAGRVWYARVEGHDHVFLRPAYPAEHAHTIYEVLKEWIDRGMSD